MAASPFAFFRGAAYVMASDLAQTPRSGIPVQLCGDAHLSNFGGFASPERDLVFDLNDFDETLPGPWEWDVERLVASIEVAGRQNGYADDVRRRIVRDAAAEYRHAMHRFAQMGILDVWYSRLDQSALLHAFSASAKRRQLKRLDKSVAKARTKDSSRAFTKLATEENGSVRIASDPPLIVPIDDLLPGAQAAELQRDMRSLLDAYRDSLSDDRAHLLERYGYADLARKVVGVGSVGTRAWVILMLGRDSGDPLFLQAKEAEASVLETFAGKSTYQNHGRRVVEGQRLMQAASDIFLGWLRATGIDGQQRDFYVRQLWDWKVSAEVETMVPRGLGIYTRMCGWTLARAHACSGDAIAIAAYLGANDTFDQAIASFAATYADQNELDHRALLAAIDSGRVAAETGL
jgi:uncharacterized protein (DUF2252 family)